MRRGKWCSILLLGSLLLVGSLAACAKPAPAAFEVVSMDMVPAEITAGGVATVAVQVKNVGGSQGVYTATLNVDGARVETKDIAVVPGATEKVTFSLSKDRAGTYQVAVGKHSSSLTVKPKLVSREMELKYDDGEADGFLVSVAGGWLVDFTPPAAPFIIHKIRLFGSRSQSGTFEIEVWDKDRKVLYKEAYPRTKFPTGKHTPGQETMPEGGAWVELEMPKIEVSDKFYVHMWNGPTSLGGIHLGADFSVKNEHSAVTARPAGAIEEVGKWTPSHFCLCFSVVNWTQAKTNWMIRVIGTTIGPQE